LQIKVGLVSSFEHELGSFFYVHFQLWIGLILTLVGLWNMSRLGRRISVSYLSIYIGESTLV